jgi:hypothetical protein
VLCHHRPLMRSEFSIVVDRRRFSSSSFAYYSTKINKNRFQKMKQLVPFDTFLYWVNDESVTTMAYVQ